MWVANYGDCRLTAMVTGGYLGKPAGWTCWYSVVRTDTSYIFDESTGEDFTVKSSKHDRRKPTERAAANLHQVWRDSLCQSFVWSAYRQTFSPGPEGWPEPDEIVLEWN